jgi:hypothetical protein
MPAVMYLVAPKLIIMMMDEPLSCFPSMMIIPSDGIVLSSDDLPIDKAPTDD